MFEGSSLVDELVEKSPIAFSNRERATEFLQQVVKGGLIKSIGRSQLFEDGAQLFYWTESLQPSKDNMTDIANARARVMYMYLFRVEIKTYGAVIDSISFSTI